MLTRQTRRVSIFHTRRAPGHSIFFMASNPNPSPDERNRRAELDFTRLIVLEAVLKSATDSVIKRSQTALENNKFFASRQLDEERRNYVVRQTLQAFGVGADLASPTTIQHLLAASTSPRRLCALEYERASKSARLRFDISASGHPKLCLQKSRSARSNSAPLC